MCACVRVALFVKKIPLSCCECVCVCVCEVCCGFVCVCERVAVDM